MPNLSDVHFECLQEKHLEEALQLCRMAGWNQLKADWMRLLSHEPQGCFAAIANDQLIGTVTTTRFDASLAWIGMMLVHSEHRRRGLATELMRMSIQYLKHQKTGCIRLDATPAGETVYRQLNFEGEWEIDRWQRPPLSVSAEIGIESEDNTLCEQHYALDSLAFGADRSRLLRQLAEQSQVVCDGEGFAMLRPGFLADYLGPVTVTDPKTAEVLVRRLCKRTRRSIFWDVPSSNPRALRLAQSLGFEPCRKLLRMRLGKCDREPQVGYLYASAGPSTG